MKKRRLLKLILSLMILSGLALSACSKTKRTTTTTTTKPTTTVGTTNGTTSSGNVTTQTTTSQSKVTGQTTTVQTTTGVTTEIFDSAYTDGEVNLSLLPKLEELKSIDVIFYNFETSKSSQQGEKKFCELVTLSVLQGLSARTEGSERGLYINVKEGGFHEDAYSTWLKELENTVGCESNLIEKDDTQSAFIKAVDLYKDFVTKTSSGKYGYILIKQTLKDATDGDGNPIQVGSQSVNAGCTIAAATGYLVVDETSEEEIKALGFEMAVDARNMSEIDAYNQYHEYLCDDIIMLCNNGQAQNRDYGIATRSYFMYESNKDDDFMNDITDPTDGKYQQGTLTIGWSSTGEVSQVNRHALYGFNFTCTNYSYNLSQMARIGASSFKQKESSRNITADPNKKYVALVMTDGDNITWHQNDFPFSNSYFGYEGEINFKMNYTMAPLMADLCPSVINYEYVNATENQYFVGGVSGSGYVYPSEYVNAMNDDALEVLTSSTNEYLRRAGLKYVEILDNTVFNRTVMNSYAKQENIEGGIVLANYDYYKQGGDIKYYNNKPFVGVAEAMWSDTPGRVAYRLNSLPVDINSANGYTIVKIHCWTSSMSDVVKMVSLLDDNIELVTVDEIMQLIKENVPQDSKRTAVPNTNYPADVDEYIDPVDFYNNLPVLDKNLFTFDNYLDYEGWNKYIGAKLYDYVSFSGEPWIYSTAVRTTVDGGSGYSIRLDGSDYGNVDSNPNSSIYAKLHVPDSDNAKFSFFVRGEAYGFDADYRTRIIVNVDGKPKIISLNSSWVEAGDDKWREVVYDVSEYKGQDVVFVIEHNSTSKEGDGEILYIDNIQIREETLSVSDIKAAKVNNNTNLTFDSGLDGMNVSGTGMYNETLKCLEAIVSAVNKNNNEADAVFYTRFDLKNFTDYTHARFGAWVQAESGKSAQVRLAVISADGKTILRGSDYVTIGDQKQFISIDLDTFRIKGGAFKYAYCIIEVRGNGSDASVYIDNASFAKYTRDLTSGYYFDKAYLLGMEEKSITSLNDLSNWSLEIGRGLEDSATLNDSIVRLYGYDFMRSDDTMVASKGIGIYSKVKNEFNARMVAYTDLTDVNSMKITLKRVEKTLTDLDAGTPQVRVIFVTDDGVTTLCDWTKITSYTDIEKSLDLTQVSGKGAILIEVDSATNGDRAGVLISDIIFN